jgi:hypothetical protein
VLHRLIEKKSNCVRVGVREEEEVEEVEVEEEDEVGKSVDVSEEELLLTLSRLRAGEGVRKEGEEGATKCFAFPYKQGVVKTSFRFVPFSSASNGGVS